MYIEGYFNSVHCNECKKEFFPLILSADVDFVLIGMVPLISNAKLYAIVVEATSEEWNEYDQGNSEKLINRIREEKGRDDIIHVESEKCIHCNSGMTKMIGKISFDKYKGMGGVIEIDPSNKLRNI